MDMLVTTGGASVGDHDLVIAALKARGMTLDFWQIAMRPGKPLLFGQLGATPGARAAGQSGLRAWSARSCSCCRHWRACPACPPRRRRFPPPCSGAAVKAERPSRRPSAGHDQHRSQRGRIVVTPFPVQDSAMLRRLALADALILRAPHAPALPEGAEVGIIRLDSLGL